MENITSTYEHNGLKVILITEDNTLEEVIDAFENVLRGSGYFYEGHLDLIRREE